MTIRSRLLLATVLATAVIPYQARLENVREVAFAYPLIGPLPSADPLGEWAGIYYFTKWQLDSGRDGLPLWEIVNRQFTVEPMAIRRALVADPGYACAEHPAPDVCRGWLAAFRSVGPEGRRHLWEAHVRALAHALRAHRRELATARVTRKERRFWRGRTCMVFLLQRLDYPMTAESVEPIIERLEPPCSPLGAAHCRIADLPGRERRTYVRTLLRWGATAGALRDCAVASDAASARRPSGLEARVVRILRKAGR